jgi:flagellar export protein FliJ
MRLRRTARDERRQQLAVAQGLEQSIYDRIIRLDGELANLRRRSAEASKSGAIDIDRLREAARYQSLLASQRRSAQQEREDCSAHVNRLRESLIEADRELKSLEKLQSRLQERHRQSQRKHELRQLDEAAIRIASSPDAGA